MIRFAGKLTPCHTQSHGDGQHTSGAMERYAWVRLGTKTHPALPRHTANTVSIPVGRWRKCRRRFKMQTLTNCGPKVTSTRTAVGQFKGQFNGAMDESSRKGSKMQAHISNGVIMDIAAFKVSHSVVVEIDATALQAKKRSA